MIHEFEVLGIHFDCFSAKEAMTKVLYYLEEKSIRTLEVISHDTLLKLQTNEEWASNLRLIDFVQAVDVEILKAAGITDRLILKEVKQDVLVKTILQYLSKNNKKVFIIAETEEQLQNFESVLQNQTKYIEIVGTMVLYDVDSVEENVVNEINGIETDCVISVLSSPYQEEFIIRNRSLLNTKLWLGLGDYNHELEKIQKRSYSFVRFLQTKVFHYKVERYRKNS